ncbi:MAG: hypothetical protein HRU70_07645 [Phycisphaeraceae bacterium]|nr:MAG: hypothetical protein HRU70_07645 [Phycisphaeraceae bacterium]
MNTTRSISNPARRAWPAWAAALLMVVGAMLSPAVWARAAGDPARAVGVCGVPCGCGDACPCGEGPAGEGLGDPSDAVVPRSPPCPCGPSRPGGPLPASNAVPAGELSQASPRVSVRPRRASAEPDRPWVRLMRDGSSGRAVARVAAGVPRASTAAWPMVDRAVLSVWVI